MREQKLMFLRAFNLTHDGRNIFAREFDGSDSSVVNLTAKQCYHSRAFLCKW